jgi:hypothetical protein
VAVGVPVPAAVSLIYGAAVSLGVLGLVVSRVGRAPAYWLAGLVGALAIFLGVLLARVPVYDDAVARRLSGRPLRAVDDVGDASTGAEQAS